MPAAYLIVDMQITDMDQYRRYMAEAPAAVKAAGGEYLVRGGQFEVLEGASRSRTVVIEFPDYASAVACYHSPEYQAAAALRKGRAEFDLIAIESYDGPQP
jgi:uncharacterized protein (DUF1330 family)